MKILFILIINSKQDTSNILQTNSAKSHLGSRSGLKNHQVFLANARGFSCVMKDFATQYTFASNVFSHYKSQTILWL